MPRLRSRARRPLALATAGIRREEACERVLVIGSLELDHDEVEARDGCALLVDQQPISAGRAFTSASAHACAQLELPLFLLLPNPRAQPSMVAVRMEMVVDIVNDLHGAGQGHWTAGFHALSRPDVKKATVRGGLAAPAPDREGKGGRPRTSADEQATLLHRYLVVRGARARSSMLVAYEVARVVRVDELALRDIHPPPRLTSSGTSSASPCKLSA